MTEPASSPRYRLSMSISHQDGVRTYIAYDHQLARPVLAHLVDTAGPYTLHDIEALLALLPAKDAAQIVENAMTERGVAVITLPSEGLNHFIAWLTDRIGVPRPSSDASAQPVAPVVPLPPVAPQPVAPPAAIAPPVAPAVMPMPLTPPPGAVSPPPVMPPPAPVAAEPRLTSSAAPAGEFTQMFRPQDLPLAAAPSAAPAMPVAALPPAPVALPPAAVAIPPAPIAKAPPTPAAGEFTQMFSPGAQKPTAGPPASATPPAPRPPSPPVATPLPMPSPPSPAPVMASPPPFVALPPAPPVSTPPASMPNAGFDARGLSSLPPLPPTAAPSFSAPPPSAWPPPVPAPALHPPALQSPAPHSLPDVALTPPTPMAAVPSVLPPPMFGLPEPGAAAKKERAIGPSEATLIMKKQVPVVTAPTAEREAATPTQKTPTRLTLPIILTINAVVLLTLALILYFVFRSPPDTVPTLTGAKAAADSTRRAAVDSATLRDSGSKKK